MNTSKKKYIWWDGDNQRHCPCSFARMSYSNICSRRFVQVICFNFRISSILKSKWNWKRKIVHADNPCILDFSFYLQCQWHFRSKFHLHCNIHLSFLSSSRFIINIPDEERQDLIRVFFQIELAHWFYLDFYCAENVELRTCGIKDFSAQNILSFISQ